MKPITCEEIRTMRTEDVLSPQRKNNYKTRLQADHTYSLVEKNLYRPMSEIQHDKEIPRKVRRLIRYLKMRAMGTFDKKPSLKSCAQEAYELSVAPKIVVDPETMLLADTVLIEEQALKIETELIIAQLEEMSDDELAFVNDFLDDDFDTSEEEEKCVETIRKCETIKKGGWSEHTLMAIVHSYSNNVCPRSTCILEAMDHVYEYIEETLDKEQKADFAVNVKLENGTLQAHSYHELQGLLGRIDQDFSRSDCLLPYLQFTTKSSLLGGFRGKKKGKGRKRKGKRKGRRDLVSGAQLGLRNPRVMTKYPPTITDEWRFEQVLETDGAGSFSAYFSIRNPTTAVNGSGTYIRATEFAKLYDEYKVMDLSVVVDYLQLNQINGRTLMAVDYDSIGTGTYTPGDLRDNQYTRDFSGTNQVSYYAKVKPLSEGTYRGTPSIIHDKGWYDFNTPPDEGFIAIAGERYIPSARICNVLLTMRVKCRRRRTINAARDMREEEEEKLLVKKLSKTKL